MVLGFPVFAYPDPAYTAKENININKNMQDGLLIIIYYELDVLNNNDLCAALL